jgi:hypothetical protein
MRPSGAVLFLAAALAAPTPALAQQKETRSEVELPLPTYDALRAAAKASRGETKEPKKRVPGYSSCRLVRASLRVDAERRRLSWEAVLDAVSGGDEPPPVPLLVGASSLGSSRVEPQTARIDSGIAGTRLLADGAGRWRVTLAGEVVGKKDDGGSSFVLPVLASVPAAFDLSLPEETLATLDGQPLGGRARVALLAGDHASTLAVRRARKTDAAPAVLAGTLAVVSRVAEAGVRTEARLDLHVLRGLLETRTLALPGASLVTATGPVIASEPDSQGRVTLRFEPPVGAGEEVSFALSFLSPRDPAVSTLLPPLPDFPAGPDERIDRTLAVVLEGGLVAEAEDDHDWTVRDSAPEASASGDELVLAWKARVGAPRPPRLALRRLKALAVASALARVRLSAWVGENGETRTLLVTEARTRGRSALRFHVPKDAVLLAARVDGISTVVSRPSEGELEVPIRGDAEKTRIDLLLQGRVAPPRAGEKLEVPAPAPAEAVERASWSLVLPIGLAVKEEGKRLAPLAERETTDVTPPPPAAASDRDALAVVTTLAEADLAATAEVVWSPQASLPQAPVAYATDLSDLGESIPPLVVTLVARKESDEWF